MTQADPATTDVVIYHNPQCGTSRNTLAIIRNAGVEPHVIEYLKTPPSRALLLRLVARTGVPLSALLREKGTPFADLGLGGADVTDDERLDAVAMHPILINRPIVVTPWGVKLCRPSESVLDILPLPQLGPITKEDGELVSTDAKNPLSTPQGKNL
jgi:arsenate reductase (glutaredoxin)